MNLGGFLRNGSIKKTNGEQGMYYCICFFLDLGDLMSNCSVRSTFRRALALEHLYLSIDEVLALAYYQAAGCDNKGARINHPGKA